MISYLKKKNLKLRTLVSLKKVNHLKCVMIFAFLKRGIIKNFNYYKLL